jgi:hypothetical protein
MIATISPSLLCSFFFQNCRAVAHSAKRTFLNCMH